MLFTGQIILNAVLKHGKAAESIYSRGHSKDIKTRAQLALFMDTIPTISFKQN